MPDYVNMTREELIDRCLELEGRLNVMRSAMGGALHEEYADCFPAGYTKNSLYHTWTSMMDRCSREEHADYHNYGGRGIRVCARWAESFSAFVSDMGPRPEAHSLDRINVNDDYSPENCRWANAVTQGANRRVTRWVTIGGEKKPISHWIRMSGLDWQDVYERMGNGESPEQILESAVDDAPRQHDRLPDGRLKAVGWNGEDGLI